MAISKDLINIFGLVFILFLCSCQKNRNTVCPELNSVELTFGNYYLDSIENNTGKFPGWILKANITNSTNDVLTKEIIKSTFGNCILISNQDTLKFYLDIIKPVFDLAKGKQREFVFTTSMENSPFSNEFEYKNNDSIYYKNIIQNWLGDELLLKLYINKCVLETKVNSADIEFKADYFEEIN
ncbi:MAG: hypothetical protein IPH61_12400 [Bacteroidetes bacterium]|nr:hypothetical protein [Bacteroidota bacterium]